MKKVLALVLAVLMLSVLFVGCGGNDTPVVDDNPSDTDVSILPADTFEIALITDVGNIDDQSFNQSAWEGVKAYAEANDITYSYYRPSEDSTDARVESIKAAIEKGAKVVVCPGFLFEETLYACQNDYPEVNFLILDGEPHDAAYNYETASNVHCILYQEEQAGYFAGYAAVKDGYTKLGFLGGMNVPAVIRYGYGFVQGANAAAVELGNAADVSIKYWYCGGFAPTDDIQIKMAGWYSDGTEAVFSCGGAIYVSCAAAAEAAGAKWIGVDSDQFAALQDAKIITSAMKGLTESVVIALTEIYDNNGAWPADKAGKTAVLGVADDCVGLPTAPASWNFSTFTVDEYNALYSSIKDGTIVVSNATDAAPEVEITVDYQN